MERRKFLKLTSGALATTVLTGGVGLRLDKMPQLAKMLPEEITQDSKIESKRGWFVRDAKITIQVGDFKYEYQGSNISNHGSQIIFGRNNNPPDLQDAYRWETIGSGYKSPPLYDNNVIFQTTSGFSGPYFMVHFDYIKPELCQVKVDRYTDEKPKFTLEAKRLYEPPSYSTYESSTNTDPDYFQGVLTIFSLENNQIKKKMFAPEPNMPIDRKFYQQAREFFDLWEVLETSYGFRRGKQIVQKDRKPLMVDFATDATTIAYLEEIFWLKIYRI